MAPLCVGHPSPVMRQRQQAGDSASRRASSSLHGCAGSVRPTQQGPSACRPAKRKALTGLETLRAIPWIFAWTQTRFHLPVWLGIGEAFKVTPGSFAPSSVCHKVCRPV